MASSEAKGKNPYSELSNVKRPKLSNYRNYYKKKKPTDKNLVESESEEVEMKEVNDPVSHPSPTSQVSDRAITDPASKEEKVEIWKTTDTRTAALTRDPLWSTYGENRPRRVPINPLELNAVLLKLKIKDIISVNKIGYGRCKAECKPATKSIKS